MRVAGNTEESVRRLRILMLGTYPTSPERLDGGVASATTYLSRALVSHGDIELVGVRVIGAGDESRVYTEFGWPILDLSLGRLSLTSLYLRQKSRLSLLIQKYQPHIVHAQGTDISGYLAVHCGVPAVVTVHGLLTACARLQTGTAARVRAQLAALFTERHTIRRAKSLIAISPYVREYYGRDIKGRVYEIPNAVASTYFSIDRTPEKGRLLFAGRIANGKGLVELLRAVMRNARSVSRVILAGAAPDPAYESFLRRETSVLGLDHKIDFAGFLSEAELQREFARAEALVLPSHQETAPMVIQQAMAAGLAVIASRVGGIPYQIRNDESGLLFEAGDEQQLGSVIGRLAREPDLSQRLGSCAKRIAAARYQSDTVALATIDAYREIVATCAMKVP